MMAHRAVMPRTRPACTAAGRSATLSRAPGARRHDSYCMWYVALR